MSAPVIASKVASPPGRVTSPLDQGRLRSRLATGERTVGVFVSAASAVTAEICAAAGVDWVLLDLEHGTGGEEQSIAAAEHRAQGWNFIAVASDSTLLANAVSAELARARASG